MFNVNMDNIEYNNYNGFFHSIIFNDFGRVTTLKYKQNVDKIIIEGISKVIEKHTFGKTINENFAIYAKKKN
jgi:hypothetical protein